MFFLTGPTSRFLNNSPKKLFCSAIFFGQPPDNRNLIKNSGPPRVPSGTIPDQSENRLPIEETETFGHCFSQAKP